MGAQAQATERESVVLGEVEGESLWFNNDLLTIKATGDQTGGEFVLLEELARRGKTTPLHAHPAETESFYVLDGAALLHVDGVEHRLGTCGFASVPAGVPHAYLVISETARLIILITPGDEAMLDFFRHAGEPAVERRLPEERPLDMERIGAAAARSGAVTILGPPPFDEAVLRPA